MNSTFSFILLYCQKDKIVNQYLYLVQFWSTYFCDVNNLNIIIMKKLLLFVCASLMIVQASAQSINESKNIVTSYEDRSINLGGSMTLSDGRTVSQPAIYFIDKGESYEAVRLSVVPPQSIDKWKPYLQSPSATSIVISWKDETVETPEIQFGTSDTNLDKKATGSKSQLSDKTATYNLNKVELTGLDPDTKYYYKVAGSEEVYSFKTQPAIGNKDHYRILLLGDHHRIDYSSYEWLIAAAKETVQKKYGAPLEEKINLVMNIGDQVDRAWLDQYERNHFYKSSYFSTGIPTMTAVGNHDVYEDADLKKWNTIFSYENLSYQGISSNTEAYYAFQEGSILFIVMNTNPDYTNDVQLNWLKQVVEAASKDNTVTFIMSSCHRPVYTETYLMDGSDPGYSEWLKNEAAPVLGSCRKHVLNTAGHQHYYHRGQMVDQNFYHLVSGGAAWWQLWEDAKDATDADLIQKTLDYWTYVIIDFAPQEQTMTAETYSLGHIKVAHNNILVDKFTVNLSQTDQPSKPGIEPITGTLELPAVIKARPYSSPGNSEFNAAQYQISQSQTFDELAYEKMLYAQNFFKDGGPAKYLPTDTQKDKQCTELELGKYALISGDYYVRVRFRNDNLEWSEWSEPQAFKAKAEICVEEKDIEPRMSIEKTLYTKDEPIKVKFYNMPTDKGAWIGMYQQLAEIPGTGSVTYAYTDNFSYTDQPGTGEVSITTDQHGTPLQEGKYFFILFGDSGYDIKLSDRIDFNITSGSGIAELSTDKVYYQVGEPINISYKGATGNTHDWIGGYLSNHTCGNGGAGSDFFKYLGAESEGTTEISTESLNGCYWVSYFLNDGYEEIANRKFICVGLEEAVVSTKKNIFAYEEYVEINLSKLPRFPILWLEVKDDNDVVVERRVINDHNASNLTFFKRYSPGKYTAQLVIPDHIAVSQPTSFSISIPTGIKEQEFQQEAMGNVLKFYPNPAEYELTIENEDIYEVLIYSPTGGLIANKKVENQKVDVTNLKSGHYIMVSYKNNQAVIGKLYKK